MLALASFLLLAYSALLWHQTSHDPAADDEQCLLCVAGDRLSSAPPSAYSAPAAVPPKDMDAIPPRLASAGTAPRTRWARGPPSFNLA